MPLRIDGVDWRFKIADKIALPVDQVPVAIAEGDRVILSGDGLAAVATLERYAERGAHEYAVCRLHAEPSRSVDA